MLNRTPKNTSNVINSYRKRRQQRGPLLVYGAIALVVIGVIIILIWIFGSGRNPAAALFPTDTPTPTLTFTPTNTITPSVTPSITETPTITLTPTRSGPVDYIIQEGDTLQAIAERFNLGDDGVLLIYNENPEIVANKGVYFAGQKIIIPAPGAILPTPTSFSNLTSGTRIDYQVLPGDTLAGIAAKFNSIVDNIVALNNITDANALNVGDTLKIPVNLVTATATLPPTSTPVSPTVAGQTPVPPATSTQAAAGGNTPSAPASASCQYQENPTFVTDLQNLINTARTSNGLAALSVNTQLAAVAKNHAIDLLCTNTLSHTGSNGSTPQSRVQAGGFTASLVVEDLYALSPVYGGNPQSAFNWWNSDPASKADLLNPNTTVFGVAYVSSDKSLLGGYFVVVSAKP